MGRGRWQGWCGAVAGMVTVFVGCGDTDPAAQRSAAVAQHEHYRIAVVWPSTTVDDDLGAGAELARERLNADGGVLGRPVELVRFDDEEDVNLSLRFAQQIADDPTIAAVVGHMNTYSAVPASTVYEGAGVVLVAPGATGMHLTDRGLDMVVRTFPNNQQLAKSLVALAECAGYRSVVIYHIDNSYGREIANRFEWQARAQRLEIVDRRPYDAVATPVDHAQVVARWQLYHSFLTVDALFLVGDPRAGASIVTALRVGDLDWAVLGGDGLDGTQFIERGGAAVEGVAIPTVFNPLLDDPAVAAFVDAYRARYGVVPGAWAAQGYDAVMLLAAAARRAGTIDPRAVADSLQGSHTSWSEPFRGVVGPIRFDERGDLSGRAVVFRVVRDGAFRPIQHCADDGLDPR